MARRKTVEVGEVLKQATKQAEKIANDFVENFWYLVGTRILDTRIFQNELNGTTVCKLTVSVGENGQVTFVGKAKLNFEEGDVWNAVYGTNLAISRAKEKLTAFNSKLIGIAAAPILEKVLNDIVPAAEGCIEGIEDLKILEAEDASLERDTILYLAAALAANGATVNEVATLFKIREIGKDLSPARILEIHQLVQKL